MGDIVMKFDAETAKAVQGFVKMENKFDALKQKQKELAESSDKMKRKGKGALDGMSKSALSYAKSFVTVTAVITAATKAQSEFNATREKGANTVKTIADSIRGIKELSSSQRNFQENLKQGKEVGILSGRGERSGLQMVNKFLSLSINKKSNQNMLARLTGELGMEDPSKFAEGAKKVQLASGGKLTLRESVNQILTGAKLSAITSGEFGGKVAGVAALGKQVGGSTAESIALLAGLSTTAKTKDEAATQGEALLSVISKKGYGEGRGVKAAILDIKSRIDKGEDINTLLPERSAMTAFLGISGKESFANFKAQTKRIQRAGELGAGEDRIAELRGFIDPRARADLKAKQREAFVESERADLFGSKKRGRQAATEEALFAVEQSSRGAVDQAFGKLLIHGMNYYGGTEEQIQGIATSDRASVETQSAMKRMQAQNQQRTNTNGLDIKVDVANEPGFNVSTE